MQGERGIGYERRERRWRFRSKGCGVGDDQDDDDRLTQSHLPAARFFQKRSRLSSLPNKLLKIVESAIRMSPARVPLGGNQTNMLNSRFPAFVNGCGRDESIGCLTKTR